MKKKIIIIHEFYTPSHYKAIYDSEDYEVEDYYSIDKKVILKKIIKSKGKMFCKFMKLVKELKRINEIKRINNKILIVGIAPYNKLFFKYKSVFKNNYSLYHTSWDVWDGSSYVHGNLKYKKKFERILEEDFKGIATVTKNVEKKMKNEKIKNSYSVVNHSLKVNEYEKKLSYKRTNKILFLGRFVDVKNIDLILRFLEKNKFKNIEFHFAGSGKKEKKIREFSLNDNRLKLLGILSKEQIKKVLKEYDYLILPSKFEPFGIVIIEALSSGVPCIVSDVIGHGEIIDNFKDGFVFKNNDYNDFERVLFKAIEIDEKKYKILSKNTLLKSKQYDVREIIKKWEELF